MADTTKPAAGPEKAAAGPKALKSSPDFATIGGLAVALLGILGGLILEKGEIADVAQGTAALIVLGGTFGAVLVSTPFDVAMRGFRKIGSVLFTVAQAPRELSENL